jgi:CRP-like cAMP-binding protein
MAKTSLDDRLAAVPLFAKLTRKQLAQVGQLVTTIDVRAGRELITEGAEGREFFVVLDGTAEVRTGDTVLNERGPGDFFGEIALLLDRPRTATVVAVTDMTVEVIERRDFKRLLVEQPALYEPLLAAVAERLAEHPG